MLSQEEHKPDYLSKHEWSAWQLKASTLAEHALKHLSNRDDAMGAYGKQGAFCHRISHDDPAERRNEQLRRLKSHFQGRTIGGLYAQSMPDKDGNWFTRFGCIDLDLKPDYPDKEMRRERNHAYAIHLRRRLDSLGIKGIIEDSNGRGGYHIWFWLTQSIPVASMYCFLRDLVSDAERHGFERSFQRVDENGQAMFTSDEKPLLGSDLPETFPKQENPNGQKLGNFIRMPGKHHTNDHWSRFWIDDKWLDDDDSVEAWLNLPASNAFLIPQAVGKEIDEPRPRPKRSAAELKSHESLVEVAERTIEMESWTDLLQCAGWKQCNGQGAETHWTRPGKSSGISATLNHQGNNLLHVFSSAVPGLLQDQSYGKWRFYCWTNGFGTDQVQAAKSYLPHDLVEEHEKKRRQSRSAAQDRSSDLFVPNNVKNEIEWPELIDLEEPLIERLRADLLPGFYGDMIRATAASTETPVEMAALVTLGVLSTATMRKYDVLVEPGYRQPLNTYCVTVLAPGNRKSAVYKSLMAPILDFEVELQKKSRESNRVAESQLQTWKKRVEDLRNQASRAKKHEDFLQIQREIENLESQAPKVPHVPQLTCDDITPECISQLLSVNEERLALISAEPDLFDMMLGRYSSMPNLGIYLKGHDGDSHKENRKSGTAVTLSGPLLTVVVMAQTDAIEEAGSQRILKGRGLLARLLFMMPPSPVGHRKCIPNPIPAETKQHYENCVRKILTVSVAKDEYDRPLPRQISLSEEAYKLWKREQVRIEFDQREGGRLSGMKEWAGKFPAAIARIAANFHVANCMELGIEPQATLLPMDTMSIAIQFAKVIESHTLCAFGIMDADDHRKSACKIIKEIRSKQLKEITRRDCTRADRKADTMMMASVLEMLVRDGYLMPLPEEKHRGRPSEKYMVNPAVHQR